MQTIVYLVPSLIKSGPINVLYNIVRHLDRDRFCPVIVALSDSSLSAKNVQADFEMLDIEVRNYNYSKWQCQLHTNDIARRLDNEFSGTGIVMHAHGYYPTLILSYFRGRHTMTTIHNICGEDFRMEKGVLLGGYMTWRYKSALRRIQICVPISDYMSEYYGRDKRLDLYTVYNGVELPSSKCSANREDIRRQLGIDKETFVLFYPAAFTERKNHSYLIDEVLSLPDLNVLIVFAGSGITEDGCKKLAAGDNRIRFLGFQMNLEKFWMAADALVSPSISEGMPMAVLEAVVRGLPCLLSSIPPHIEIAKNVFGTNHWCFETNEKGVLGNMIAEAEKEKFKHEDIAAKAALHYGSEVMCRGYEQLYSQFEERG